MPRHAPKLTTDEEAESFLAQDRSGLDFAQFKPATFEFAPKSERVNMRLPKTLLDAVKQSATDAGMPYQRFIRHVLERAVTAGKKA